jgi:hypothetical protein
MSTPSDPASPAPTPATPSSSSLTFATPAPSSSDYLSPGSATPDLWTSGILAALQPGVNACDEQIKQVFEAQGELGKQIDRVGMGEWNTHSGVEERVKQQSCVEG